MLAKWYHVSIVSLICGLMGAGATTVFIEHGSLICGTAWTVEYGVPCKVLTATHYAFAEDEPMRFSPMAAVTNVALISIGFFGLFAAVRWIERRSPPRHYATVWRPFRRTMPDQAIVWPRTWRRVTLTIAMAHAVLLVFVAGLMGTFAVGLWSFG